MPLPKALPRSASKRKKRQRMNDVMHDLKQGPHHSERTHQQEIAIGIKESGMSRTKKRSKKRSTSRKRKRSATHR